MRHVQWKPGQWPGRWRQTSASASVTTRSMRRAAAGCRFGRFCWRRALSSLLRGSRTGQTRSFIVPVLSNSSAAILNQVISIATPGGGSLFEGPSGSLREKNSRAPERARDGGSDRSTEIARAAPDPGDGLAHRMAMAHGAPPASRLASLSAPLGEWDGRTPAGGPDRTQSRVAVHRT